MDPDPLESLRRRLRQCRLALQTQVRRYDRNRGAHEGSADEMKVPPGGPPPKKTRGSPAGSDE